ncbi:Type II restriction enzyme, methylase subunit YeeA [Brevundimonas diminuta 3F5N]|uniref:site-specific DNA-methyltransferase (adenine-specific) n=2 Tax=Brevundimonas diminuta TaxID=293 RepID=A0A1R4GB84_BREDI|nr:Type II restriction enzyme, methylase subunit YeeA [Brevundimonas diminuta 3F5N]
MMNPTEIADALDALAQQPFAPETFGLSFAEATDNPQATLAKLRNGSTGKSDVPGGMLLSRKFHYAPAEAGQVEAVLTQLRASKKNKTGKPAILLATDGQTIAAEHPKSGAPLHCAFSELGAKFSFFLPAAGKERYQAAEENPVDVRATGKLARLYDALLKANPDWRAEERRHDMNLFMTRLIFCLFAEDVGVFPESQFSSVLFDYSGDRGEHARETLIHAFTAMNLPEGERSGLPVWAGALKYVNGGLFAGAIDAPVFDVISFRYLRDASGMDWKLINPDIFGSMIQSIADEKARSELGMHYTSVPNIMKVLGPLFLDDLDAEIDKAWDKPAALRAQLARLSKIRVFDPACGSGNFLVVAYRQMRERELRLMKRLGELDPVTTTMQMFSSVGLDQFYGVEINDFAAETAKLALFIAEYQANARLADVFGRMPALLPLRDGGNIVCDNSLRLNWEEICPPPEGEEEVYIAGNPPFLGDNSRSDEQNADMDFVLSGHLEAYRRVDFVACWMFKAANYIRGRNARSALVSTNSICQGQAVGALWPAILRDGVEIGFAHTSFKWRNNASANAAVICVVVGLRNESRASKLLFAGDLSATAGNINAYLLDGPSLFVDAEARSIFGLPYMEYGNKPTDGGHLILSPEERDELIALYPDASKFIKRFMGSEEAVKGKVRFCLWVTDGDAEEAAVIPPIKSRFEAVAAFRAASTAAQTRPWAAYPHKFRQAQNWARDHAILIPRVSSERRPYLPVVRVGADVISSDLNQAIYDGPDWCIALIAARLHLVWIGTVCGKLKSDFRYSNTLGWNTFPVPKFTQEQLDQLSASARRILRTRYEHHPATIAQLYDPDKMPDDLRQAHKDNDDLLESMYIGRPFRNDTERLETLFKLYAAKTAQ